MKYPIKSVQLNGNDIRTYSIVHSVKYSESEKTAVSELVRYIEKSTGIVLPVYDDVTPEREREIVIGSTNRKRYKTIDGKTYINFNDEEYLIICEADKLYIAGGTLRGTLYGVYTFLEEYVGWRWLAPGVEKTIFKGDIVIEDIYIYDSPVFEYRDVYYHSAFDPEWSVKMKLNSTVTRKLDEKLGGGVGYAGEHFVHTFNVFMPIKDYFPEHPEYFALQNGKRNGNYLYTQLCLTHPDVLRIMTEQVIKRLEENPDARIISVSQDDSYVGDSYCHCDACEKIHKEEGSPMGTLLRFVNTIADSVSVRFPNVAIDTLAYQHTFIPPLKTRPRDNVIIRLCTWNPIISRKHRDSDGIEESLHHWRRICNRVYIWDYTANFSDYIVTLPNFDNLRDNIGLFKNYEVKGIFAQGNYQSVSGEFGELKSYLLAKLLLDPEMTKEEYRIHMDEFLKGYYGHGWRYIKKYINYVQKIIKGSDASMRGTPTDILPPGKFDYAFAESWWDSAEKEADNEDMLKRIQRSRFQLIHWKLISEGHIGDGSEREYFKKLREAGITFVNEGADVPVPSI